jgi:16S rRNA (uracil1498-N3)-methyltransferase
MSHIPRLFIEQPLQDGAPIPVSDAQSHYLIRVMRLPDGSRVRCFNGRDGEWNCHLQVTGKKAALAPHSQVRKQVTGPDLTLLFAPIKKARTDFIIEKATELGTRTIQPVFTDFTQSQRIRPDRMRALAIEAAEQTERIDVPLIEDGIALNTLLADWNQDRPLVYCDEGSEAAPMATYHSRLQARGAGILIGPEGGFSEKERQRLHSLDFVLPITLGPRILRAETAAVSALTLWQSLVGDWLNPPYLPDR